MSKEVETEINETRN